MLNNNYIYIKKISVIYYLITRLKIYRIINNYTRIIYLNKKLYTILYNM